MFRTINFKFVPSNKERYLELMGIVRDIFNIHTEWSYKNQTFSKDKAHKALYLDLKNRFKIPSSILQATRDVALEAVKRGKFKCKRPECKSKYMTVRYNDCTISRHGLNSFTLSTLDKREKVYIKTPDDKERKEIFLNWKFKNASVSYCKKTNVFWLHLQFYKPDPIPVDPKKILGIDLGIHNLVTTSNSKIKWNSKELRKHQRKYLYLRSKLQAKGTASSKRHLRRLSGKQMRFSKDLNHVISKKLVNLDYDTFVMEDLKGVRNTKHFSKKVNKWLSNWSFNQLQNFIEYKAKALGKNFAKVNPAYTSQTCSKCGTTNKKARFKSHYRCSHCGFKIHADYNAAINIKNRYLQILSTIKQEDRSVEQGAVNHPIVSDSKVLEIAS